MGTIIGVLGVVGFIMYMAKYSGKKARIKYYFQGYFRALRNGLSEDEALESVKDDYLNSSKGGVLKVDFEGFEEIKSLIAFIICIEFKLNKLGISEARREVDEVYESLLPAYEYLLKNKVQKKEEQNNESEKPNISKDSNLLKRHNIKITFPGEIIVPPEQKPYVWEYVHISESGTIYKLIVSDLLSINTEDWGPMAKSVCFETYISVEKLFSQFEDKELNKKIKLKDYAFVFTKDGDEKNTSNSGLIAYDYETNYMYRLDVISSLENRNDKKNVDFLSSFSFIKNN